MGVGTSPSPTAEPSFVQLIRILQQPLFDGHENFGSDKEMVEKAKKL